MPQVAGQTRRDLAAFDAVQDNTVAALLQRLSNECSAESAHAMVLHGVDWGRISCIIEIAAKEVRRITGEREVPFRAS